MNTTQHANLNKMIEKLGDIIAHAGLKQPYTIVGILSGGGYIAEGLMHYLKSKNIECSHFNIRLDKTNKTIIEGEDLIKNDGTTYIFVDDAIWSSATINMLRENLVKRGIIDSKIAVLLDPTHKADYSIYS